MPPAINVEDPHNQPENLGGARSQSGALDPHLRKAPFSEYEYIIKKYVKDICRQGDIHGHTGIPQATDNSVDHHDQQHQKAAAKNGGVKIIYRQRRGGRILDRPGEKGPADETHDQR